MEEKKLFNDRYFLERLLGRGNFSEVWLAKDTKTDIKVALKIYAPATGLDDAGLNVFAREFSLVVNANHKNLLKPLYYDSSDRKPFLVLPFCEKGSIMKDVGKFKEKEAWRLLRDVASGLAWLHAMQPPVIHQDIKPDNVMVGENGDFMITDFGVSTHLKSALRKSMSAAFSSAGTIAYMAPERFSKDNTPIMANDIYSLGATVYEMLSGDTPFGDDGGLIQLKGAEVPELKGEYSAQLKEVISRCLRKNPWERPTAEQLEKYSEDGLNGRKILFAGDKTFWGKYKYLIIGALLILVGGCIFGITEYQKNLERREARMAYDNRVDSLLNVHKASIRMGDSLAAVGLRHDEGFDVELIKAKKYYEDAESARAELGTLNINVDISKNVSAIDTAIKKAYVELREKAALIEADPDPVIAAEGKNIRKRADALKAVMKLPEKK